MQMLNEQDTCVVISSFDGDFSVDSEPFHHTVQSPVHDWLTKVFSLSIAVDSMVLVAMRPRPHHDEKASIVSRPLDQSALSPIRLSPWPSNQTVFRPLDRAEMQRCVDMLIKFSDDPTVDAPRGSVLAFVRRHTQLRMEGSLLDLGSHAANAALNKALDSATTNLGIDRCVAMGPRH